MLLVLPWSGFWEQNYFAGVWPGLRTGLTNNFVRGGVSGLGIVNLVAGMADLSWLLAARDRPSADGRDRAEPPL